jgi:DHA1 family tetracycline resistance protein-like MFS transporter
MSEPPPQVDDAPMAVPRAPKGALKIIFLIVLSDLLGFSIIIPLLPFYARHYHGSDFQVGLLFSVYSICQLIGSPVLGLISDRFGRRPVLIVSQIGSVAGFVLLGVATHGDWFNPTLGLWLVYLSRVIDGLSGGNISTAQAYISDVTTGEERTKGMGVLGAAFGIGFAIGPALGGILGHYNPSYPAFAAALCSGVAALQTWLRLPEPARHEHSETEAWLHPSRFLPIIRNPALLQMLLIFFFSMMAFVMMESTFAIYLNDLLGFNELKVGLLFALAGVTIAVVQGGFVGRLSKRLGPWPLVILGPLLVTLAMLLLASLNWHATLALILLAILLNATGRSLQTPTLSALISHTGDPRQQGTIFGLFHMLGSMARVVGPMATIAYTRHRAAPYLMAAGITFAISIWSVWLKSFVQGRADQRGFEVAVGSS